MKLKRNPGELSEAYTARMVDEWWQGKWRGGKLREAGYKLSDYGVWEVRGEDPNPDLHGPHRQTHLGTFEGTLEDVIAEAVNLPEFFAWGGGGDIFLATEKRIKKVSGATRRRKAKLREEIKALSEKLDALKKEYEEA